MGKVKWYKRDPKAALTGMFGLTLEQRGAYNTVLDLIYDTDNNLHDDDKFVAGWMHVDVRIWRRIRAELIEAGKLYTDCGYLRNRRADVGVDDALSRLASAADAGRASAAARAAKSGANSNENKDLLPTAVPTGVSTPVSTTHTHTHNTESSSSKPGTSSARARAPKFRPGNGYGAGTSTIADPDERIARFQHWLARQLNPSNLPAAWSIIYSASDPHDPNFAINLARCKSAAKTGGKGWPQRWPKITAARAPPKS